MKQSAIVLGVFGLLFVFLLAFPRPSTVKRRHSKADVDWSDVARRVSSGQRPADEPRWIQDYRKKLATQRVTFNFSATPLSEVLQILQDFTGLNIDVSRSIDPEHVKVDLHLRNVIAQNALDIILAQTGLTMTYRNETLLITPRDEGAYSFEAHDVWDLADADTFSPEKLEAYVKGMTGGGDNWGEPSSYELHRRQIIVNQTADIHDAIRKALADLRRRTTAGGKEVTHAPF